MNRLGVLATVVALAVMVGGCTSPGPQAATPEPTANTGSPLVPGDVTEIATGLDMPWGLAFLPDGSASVSSRVSGEITRVPASGGEASLVGVVPDVQGSSEGGLLGLATSSRPPPTRPSRQLTVLIGWCRPSGSSTGRHYRMRHSS